MAIIVVTMSLRYAQWDHHVGLWNEDVSLIDSGNSFLFGFICDFLLADGAGKE